MADALKPCVVCQARPRRNAHANTKYCTACQQERLTRPRSTLTPAQGAEVLRLAGTLPKADLCQRLGVSSATVSRFLREQGVRPGHYNAYKSDIVTAVCTAYETLGKKRTQQLFPDVRVRSIVERYKAFSPRQIRWTGEQHIAAIRMAGLVSATAQARYFDRPNAFEGSIKSFWVKVVRCAPSDVNGLSAHHAWHLVQPGAPATLVTHANSRGQYAIKILWLDLVQHLRPDVAPDLREAVQCLARFQAWLHGTDDPAAIRQMITEREGYARDDDPHERDRDRTRALDDLIGGPL